MNSVVIPFNSNIIKIHSFLHKIMTTIAKIWFIVKSFYLKNTNNGKYHTLLMHLFYLYQFLLKYLFYHILAFILHAKIHLRKFVDSIYHLLLKQI